MSRTPEVFIQFKNTEICLDFRCRCGAEGHYDGYFASNVNCPACGDVFSIPHTLQLGEPYPDAPTVDVVPDEDAEAS